MHAPTAASLLKQIAASRRQADAVRVMELTPAERAAVVHSLERVRPTARIDVACLIAETRRELAERSARKPLADPLRYEATLLSDADLLRRIGQETDAGKLALLRAEMQRREEVHGPLGLDDLADDLDDEPARRKRRPHSIQRTQSRRNGVKVQATPENAPQARDAAPRRPVTPERTYLIPKLFGSGSDARPYGAPWDADWDAWRTAAEARPPWLIDDGSEDEMEYVA
jgi:hypothetical protein